MQVRHTHSTDICTGRYMYVCYFVTCYCKFPKLHCTHKLFHKLDWVKVVKYHLMESLYSISNEGCTQCVRGAHSEHMAGLTRLNLMP